MTLDTGHHRIPHGPNNTLQLLRYWNARTCCRVVLPSHSFLCSFSGRKFFSCADPSCSNSELSEILRDLHHNSESSFFIIFCNKPSSDAYCYEINVFNKKMMLKRWKNEGRDRKISKCEKKDPWETSSSIRSSALCWNLAARWSRDDLNSWGVHPNNNYFLFSIRPKNDSNLRNFFCIKKYLLCYRQCCSILPKNLQ